jgi:hypothetical protein
MNKLVIGKFLRLPEAGAVLSLVTVVVFFAVFGGVLRVGLTSRPIWASWRFHWGC